MDIKRIEDFKGGWFIGNFEPTAWKTDKFEAAIHDYKKGEELFVYNGATHKCISVNGIACTARAGEEPFFEIPKAALKYIES